MTRVLSGVVASSLFLVCASGALAQQPPAQQQPQAPPMTNLQIYPKDTPRPEIVTTMQGFVQALGVQASGGCGYCHEGQAPQFNFASDAIGRKASSKMAASVALFVLAIGALSAGSMGLIIHYYRHKRAPGDDSQESGLHIYHEADCHVDQPLLDRLIEAEKTLAQEIRDNNWEVDWDANQRHRRLGEQAVQGKNLPTAFREYCRALLPLTDTLERYRNKEEIFQPLWDKVKKE